MEALASSHTQSVDELAITLKNFGLESVPKAPNTYPALNPVDIYRSHITELLASVSGIDPKIIYPALQWTQTLDKGDLTLPVPALRVKGKKPAELAVELGEKVHKHFDTLTHIPNALLKLSRLTTTLLPKPSSPNPRSCNPPSSKTATCNSSSSLHRSPPS